MGVLPRITDFSRAQWIEWARSKSLQGFRGEQIFRWVIGRGVLVPDAMSDLSLPVRTLLAAEFEIGPPEFSWSRDEASTTEKIFVRKEGGDGVEAVLIMEGDRTTACLSSQLGCPVACKFCASGLLGLKRNLSQGEILDQFLILRQRAVELGRRIGNIVMMGMGEPLLNYNAVVGALEALNDAKGGGIGARHLTISTIGMEKGVNRLAEEGRQYTLAFSLHAPDDAIRSALIPFAGAMEIDSMIVAARRYLEGTGREVTFEYVLLAGVNDAPSHARRLAERLRGVRGTVNIIPYNENPGLPYARPSPETTDHFVEILRDMGLKVSVRKRKGHRILAACGQLRLRELAPKEGG